MSMPTHSVSGDPRPTHPVPLAGGGTGPAALIPWLALFGTIGLYQAWVRGLPAWLAGAVLGVMFVAGWVRARPELAARRARVAAVILLSLTAALVLLTFVTQPPDRAMRVALSRAIPPLVGWNLILWLPGIGAPPSNGAPWRWLQHPPPLLRWGAAAAYLALLALLLYEAAGWHLVLQDEALYVVQAAMLDEPAFGWRMPAEHIPFFRPEYSLYRDGILRTQYSFGFPAVLAAFDLLHLQWWTNPVLAAVTVAAVYWIGARLHSPFAGAVAALFVGAQEWFLFNAAGSMPHIATGAMLSVAAALLLRSETAGRVSQPALRIAAGMLLGWAVAARPLTGVAVGAGIGLWMIVRQRWAVAALVRLGVPVVIGLLPLALLTMYYNDVTTGDPLTFGYAAVHGSLHDLGFGMRGFRLFAGGLEAVDVANPFLLPDALRNLHNRSWEFALELLPVFTVLPLLWLALARGARPAWFIVAAFMLLPLGHFFHFNSRIRFYVELVPFAAIGLALLVAHLAATDWRRTAAPLVAAIALLAALRLVTVTRSDDAAWSRVVASAEQLESEHARRGDLLVFIEEDKPEAYLFRRLWKFDAEGYDSDILVARSWGPERNRALAAEFPNRTALTATWRGVGQDLLIEPVVQNSQSGAAPR